MTASAFKNILQKYSPYAIVALCVITLSFYVYVNVLLKSRLDSAQLAYDGVAKLAAAPGKVAQTYRKFEETPFFAEINKSLSAVEEVFKKAMPGLRNFGNLADSIQALAGECDVELIKLNIFNPAENSPQDIISMKVRLECRSTYKAFKKFLWSLEKCTNIVFIRNLTVTSKLSEEKLTYNFDLESFIKKQ